MIFDIVHSARVGDSYLLIVDTFLFWAATLALGILAVATAYLANRPQPNPLPGLWALSKVDRDLQMRRVRE